ncbi:hypothetical protein [Kocuria sp. CH-021]|uniref:hypothetical protein n=1 Tax=Kocuria sp. CH-021 TaxID=3406735 RepID=UPI003C726541
MKRNRLACLAAASLLAASSIGLAATPAVADTTRYGCTVYKPAGPRADGVDGSNRVMIKWVIDVKCDKGRTIHVHQIRMEEDDGTGEGRGDDYVGEKTYSRSFRGKAGTHRFTYREQLPQTKDAGGGKEPNEEMYQKVRFRVSSNGVVSSWTNYERGGASWIFH